MSVWIVVIAVGAGTYLFRISMLVLAARRGLPPVLERATRFAVPTAFAALAATALAHSATSTAAALPQTAAVAAGAIAVRRSGNPRTALLIGLPTLWILSAVVR